MAHETPQNQDRGVQSWLVDAADDDLGDALKQSAVLRVGMVVTLQAHDGRFCSRSPKSACESSSASSHNERFSVHSAGPGRIKLGGEGQDLTCAPAGASFEVIDIDVGQNTVAFKRDDRFCVPTPTFICSGEQAATADTDVRAKFKVKCISGCEESSPTVPAYYY